MEQASISNFKLPVGKYIFDFNSIIKDRFNDIEFLFGCRDVVKDALKNKDTHFIFIFPFEDAGPEKWPNHFHTFNQAGLLDILENVFVIYSDDKERVDQILTRYDYYNGSFFITEDPERKSDNKSKEATKQFIEVVRNYITHVGI